MQACEHIFVEGYFSDEALEIIFRDTHENQREGHRIEENRIISARMIEKVIPFQADGAWLDVGFGNASLLFTAQEFGFHPVGADFRRESTAVLNRLGIEAHCGHLNEIDCGRKFSVISFMDVLEHAPYPRVLLDSAKALLIDAGVLMVSMPNTESMLWRLMSRQNQNPYCGEIEHYHNFSRTRLYALLEEFGFSAVRYGISERYRACMEIVAIKAP